MNSTQEVHAPVEAAGPGSDVLALDAARGMTDRIRSITVTALDALADLEGAVQAAYVGRAWLSLGYDSWEAYCEAEFSQTRMWATVEERHTRTLALREGGLSQRAIAAVLGIGKGTVVRHLSLSTAQCGAVDNADDATGPGASARLSRSSSAQVLERQVNVARLRAQGLPQVAVARELGVSQATVSADESVLIEATAALETDTRATVEAVLAGNGPVDIERLAESIGLELAASTTPGALLVASSRAIARDLRATVAYLRDEVVFSDCWVRDEAAAEEASAILVSPLASAVCGAAQALARLDASRVREHELTRARSDAAQAATWLQKVDLQRQARIISVP